jgi:hypothetical protein
MHIFLRVTSDDKFASCDDFASLRPERPPTYIVAGRGAGATGVAAPARHTHFSKNRGDCGAALS